MLVHPSYLKVLQQHPFPHPFWEQLDDDGLLPVDADTGLLVGSCASSEEHIGTLGEVQVECLDGVD